MAPLKAALAHFFFKCRMDKMVEPLKVTVTTKVKANSVKQEFEKQDELKRSAMRALAALMVIPGADKHPQLNEFLNQVLHARRLKINDEGI